MYCFRTSASLPSSLTTDSDGRSCSHARADGIIAIVSQTSALVHTRPAVFCSDVPSPSGGGGGGTMQRVRGLHSNEQVDDRCAYMLFYCRTGSTRT